MRRLLTSKWLLIPVGLLAVMAGIAVWLNRPSSAPSDAAPPEAGSYANLMPEHRYLVDDWVARLAEAAGKPLDARTLYGDLGLSTRTTFTAVTHALSNTALDDDAGQPMHMTALDLIERIDTVKGSEPGQGGDQQFRLYVELKPGAQATLEKSRQFTRQVDNTMYHKGYPICFRGAGGTPSIQFSLSSDGQRGDVDVDYRSSTFPVMLVNGHLTASNSDVRAGNNDERHNRHWTGLQNWWRGFMGVPLFEAPREAAAALASAVATEPRVGKGATPDAAVYDFLTAWIVEGNAGRAVGSVASRAFSCLEVERGITVDPGVARVQMARTMQSLSTLMGKPGALAGVVRSVSLSGPRGKAVEQPHGDVFAMYELRDDLAAELDCENRLHPEQADQKQLTSTRFSGAIGAVFRLQTPKASGETVATVWAQEKGVWKLVSYDVEPEVRLAPASGAPPPATAAPEPPRATVPGDPAMTRAAQTFLDAWFVQRDAAAAFRFLSPKSYACYNAFRSEDVPQAASNDEAGRLLQERMTTMAEWTGPAARLEDVLAPADPQNRGLRIVQYDSPAFSVIALPDRFGASFNCATLSPGQRPYVDLTGAQMYGRYYAVSMRLKRGGPDAAVLWTLWAKESGAWKVVSYLVVTP